MISLFYPLFFGICSGIIAAAYSGILSEEPTFNFWWRFGARYEGKFFFKPVWGCGHCFAGQFAAWTFIGSAIVPAMIHAARLHGWENLFSVHYATRAAVGLFRLILAISAAIVTAKGLIYVIQKKLT